MPGQPSLEVYDGQLHLLPDAVSEIAQKRIYKLREILSYHNILDCGTKARWLQKWQCSEGGRKYLASCKELEAICNLDSEKIHNIRPKTLPV